MMAVRWTGGLLLFVLAGCVTDAVTGERKFSVVQWTPEEERQMGHEFAPNIESQFDAVYPDAEAGEYLGALVKDMVSRSPRKDDFDFHFKILNSSIPNAFALPGGYVYITRGLLQHLETEGQFISVMGHELGHVEHRHSMLNQSSASLLSLPTRPLAAIGRVLPVGGGAVNMVNAVIGAPSALLGLKFNREQELEADLRGVYFSSSMGFDPRDGKKTFELFKRLEEETPGGPSEFSILRTHPLNDDRVAGIETEVRTHYPQLAARPEEEFRASDERFLTLVQSFKDRAPAYERYDEALFLLNDPNGDDDTLKDAFDKLTEAEALVGDEPLFNILQGEVLLLQGDGDAAYREFVEAERLYQEAVPDDGHWKVDMYLGIFELQSELHDRAIQHLVKATERFPMNAAPYLFLAQAYEATGQKDEARRAYDSAVQHAPPGSAVEEEARKRRREL